MQKSFSESRETWIQNILDADVEYFRLNYRTLEYWQEAQEVWLFNDQLEFGAIWENRQIAGEILEKMRDENRQKLLYPLNYEVEK